MGVAKREMISQAPDVEAWVLGEYIRVRACVCLCTCRRVRVCLVPVIRGQVSEGSLSTHTECSKVWTSDTFRSPVRPQHS